MTQIFIHRFVICLLRTDNYCIIIFVREYRLKMKSALECPLCGTEVDERQDYCSECGETLKKE